MKKPFIILSFMLLAAMPVSWAGAGRFRLAGVLIDSSRIGQSANRKGYEIRVYISPMAAHSSQNARYKIQIGIVGDNASKRNAANLWALYE